MEDEIVHLETCLQLNVRTCPASSNNGYHRWSGWPGARCQDCGDEDANELCLVDGCSCACHKELWESYDTYIKNEES
jgi:hypothetical protein